MESNNPNIDAIMERAQAAFAIYRKQTLKQRADFMRAIAVELENIRAEIVPLTMEETHLPEARLNGELSRTIFQLNDYAAHAEAGSWMDVRINKGQPTADVNIRKMLVPLGPVVVFGASNFPYAYSTAGGDTACALAAGCPVIVKAHPGHEKTSARVAEAIGEAARKQQLPEGVFQHVSDSSFAAGKALVTHPLTQAVGFTGSLTGGKALFDMANQRKTPIPVFAEMGSVNPVVLLPEKIETETAAVAEQYAASITQGVGQFCTNPGLLFGIESTALQQFIDALAAQIKMQVPQQMLHPGIARAYTEKRALALEQKGVSTEAVAETDPAANEGAATLASVSGATFLSNPLLHQEVFGPYSLIVRCTDQTELQEALSRMEGQLTSTIMATEKDARDYAAVIEAVQQICGRLVMNGVPTGVAVCTAMQHGGPFPSTTDSRFTSVGSDGIRRFARPLAYQNFPDALLPDALKDGNPLGIWRTVNDQLSRDAI